ncbi:MAG TPA: hypothetical protein VGF59_31510, partial [Bryobacteraceae bacterium]
DRGFFRAMSDSSQPARIDDGLGRGWKITENCFKLHSCCGHTHSAIDAALDIRARADGAPIAAVHIETYGPGYEIVKEANPRTPYQAQFSIAYCVAAALCEGRVGLDQFQPDRFAAVADLLARTRVAVEPDLTAKYPAAWPARVTVTLANGEVLRAAADYPRGNPENPVSTAELEDKLRSLVAPRFGDETAAHAIDAVHAIDICDDMSRLFRDLLP